MSSSPLAVVLDALKSKASELDGMCVNAAGDPQRSVILGLALEREMPGVIRAVRGADALILVARSLRLSCSEVFQALLVLERARNRVAARALALDRLPGCLTADYAEAALADIERASLRHPGVLSTALHVTFANEQDPFAHIWAIVALTVCDLESTAHPELLSFFLHEVGGVEDANTLSDILTCLIEKCLPLYLNAAHARRTEFGKLLFRLHQAEVAALGGVTPLTQEQYLSGVEAPQDELKLAV